MNREPSQTIAILYKLIETCRDGQEGFLAAADRVPDGDLKALFNSYSRQRAQFLRELQEEVRRRGGELETTGSLTGTLRREWMEMKGADAGDCEGAIMTECERGEDAARQELPGGFGRGVTRGFACESPATLYPDSRVARSDTRPGESQNVRKEPPIDSSWS